MATRKKCPTCLSKVIFVYNCHKCGKICCEACMITCYCIDCYTVVQNSTEIARYNTDKYKGVPNEV